MPFSRPSTSGFSPTPLPSVPGNQMPTLHPQPFYRQLDAVKFNYNAGVGPAIDRILFLEFLENNTVFANIFLAVAVSDGMEVRAQLAQRISDTAVASGNIYYCRTSLPVGFWVEPNVTVRLRADGGDVLDGWDQVVIMLGPPEKEVPAALKG